MLNSFILWIFMAIYIIAYIIININKKKNSFHIIVSCLFYVYIGCVLSVAFFPLPIQKEAIQFLKDTNYIQYVYIPFHDIMGMIKMRNIHTITRNIVGNILMFMPFGFLFSLVRRKHFSFKMITLYGFFASSCIEILQVTIGFVIGARYKIFSVDDIILNTLGTALGYICFSLFRYITDNFKFLRLIFNFDIEN